MLVSHVTEGRLPLARVRHDAEVDLASQNCKESELKMRMNQSLAYLIKTRKCDGQRIATPREAEGADIVSIAMEIPPFS